MTSACNTAAAAPSQKGCQDLLSCRGSQTLEVRAALETLQSQGMGKGQVPEPEAQPGSGGSAGAQSSIGSLQTWEQLRKLDQTRPSDTAARCL